MGDVAVEQVLAAGAAQGFDLGEELEERGGRVLGAAFAQVVAVGIDQGGAVERSADQALGLGHTGVAFHVVQRQVEPPGAFEQPDALLQQVVDLVPTLPVRRGALTHADRGPSRPAGRMRGDLLVHGLDRVVPDVPAISALHASGSARRMASP